MADTARNKKKILVVEDEVVISNICRVALEAEGFEVYITPDCREAQKIINEVDLDLCLIDILIPEMSGRQLYQWLLKTHPQLANKVVFCTGMAVEENMKRFLKQSGCPLLLKPFSLDELIDIIQKTMQGQNG